MNTAAMEEAIKSMPEDVAAEMWDMFEVYKQSLNVEKAADDFLNLYLRCGLGLYTGVIMS